MNAPRILMIGEVMLASGLISKEQLELCLRAQAGRSLRGVHQRLGEVIMNYGFAHRADIEAAIASTGRIADGLGAFSFPTALLKRIKAYPIGLHNGVLKIAASSSLDDLDRSDLVSAASEAGLVINSIDVVPRDRMEVLKAIGNLSCPDRATVSAEIDDLESRFDDGAFITQVISHIFIDALQSRASDIHFFISNDPDVNWIAYRIDGVMRFTYMLTPPVMAVISTRIKSDSGIDSGDVVRPQDGRTQVKYLGKQIDIRVSTLPVDFGEKMVLRLLDSSSIPGVAKLFALHPKVATQLAKITKVTKKSGGIFLTTGATGSGKSTTLNAIMSGMDRSAVSIATVEDPVELRIPLVGHTQLNEAAGLTYEKVLRAILRQDPDIIMVGELRDNPTVALAMKAAETGHLMMSTLHTDSVGESVNRLLGMMDDGFRHIGRYILAGSLKGIVNQKLAGRICQKCAEINEVPDYVRAALIEAVGAENTPDVFYKGVGCERCNGTGKLGRVIIPEAVFIGNDRATREGLEDILVNGKPFRESFDLPGVIWYPRSEAVGAVLKEGIIDTETAVSLLDLTFDGVLK